MPITDFHSHVLPGVDDGSASPEESLAMLRLEAQQGIHRVIATPHFYPHRHTVEIFRRKKEVGKQLAGNKVQVEIDKQSMKKAQKAIDELLSPLKKWFK